MATQADMEHDRAQSSVLAAARGFGLAYFLEEEPNHECPGRRVTKASQMC
jgi:hypothetical protein